MKLSSCAGFSSLPFGQRVGVTQHETVVARAIGEASVLFTPAVASGPLSRGRAPAGNQVFLSGGRRQKIGPGCEAGDRPSKVLDRSESSSPLGAFAPARRASVGARSIPAKTEEASRVPNLDFSIRPGAQTTREERMPPSKICDFLPRKGPTLRRLVRAVFGADHDDRIVAQGVVGRALQQQEYAPRGQLFALEETASLRSSARRARMALTRSGWEPARFVASEGSSARL